MNWPLSTSPDCRGAQPQAAIGGGAHGGDAGIGQALFLGHRGDGDGAKLGRPPVVATQTLPSRSSNMARKSSPERSSPCTNVSLFPSWSCTIPLCVAIHRAPSRSRRRRLALTESLVPLAGAIPVARRRSAGCRRACSAGVRRRCPLPAPECRSIRRAVRRTWADLASTARYRLRVDSHRLPWRSSRNANTP